MNDISPPDKKKTTKRRPRSADRLRRGVKLSVNVEEDQGDESIIKASMSGINLQIYIYTYTYKYN